MKIRWTLRFAGKRRVALVLAVFSLCALLAIIGIEILPSLVPGLRYSYTLSTGAIPPMLVGIPLPITGWLYWALVAVPWVDCVLFMVCLFLIADEHRREQSRTVHQPVISATSARNQQVYQWSIAGLCIMMILSFVMGFTGGNMAWAVARQDDMSVVLRRVAMVSATEGWAVGGIDVNESYHFGVIWHYSRGRWARTPTTLTVEQLYGVTALSNGDAWAVGAGATILYEHNGAWTLMPPAKGLDGFISMQDKLYSIAMISPNEGWAVGGWTSQSDDLFLGDRWNSGSDNNPYLSSPFVSNPARGDSNLLAYKSQSSGLHGYNSRISLAPLANNNIEDDRCLLLHYINGQWSRVSCPRNGEYESGALESLSLLPGGDIWAGGQGGTILHEYNGTWVFATLPQGSGIESGDTIQRLIMVSSTKGWLIEEGSLFCYEKGKITEQSINGIANEASRLTLYDLTMTSPDEGWAVGDGGFLHFHKGSWQFVKPSLQQYSQIPLGIASVPGQSNEFWVVGEIDVQPLILHGHDSTWSIYTT